MIIFLPQYGLVCWNDSQVFIYVVIAFVYTSCYYDKICKCHTGLYKRFNFVLATVVLVIFRTWYVHFLLMCVGLLPSEDTSY